MRQRAERAEERADRLEEHFRRLERAELGLPEEPRKPKPPPEPEPPEVRDLIQSFEGSVTRRYLRDECRRLRSDDVPWSEIRRRLEEQHVHS